MSEVEDTAPSEEDYVAARQEAIDATIRYLRIGDQLGKEQHLMAAEFMGAFQQAASEILGE